MSPTRKARTRKLQRRRLRGGGEENALYLGMATDIASALILAPTLTTLFVMNKLDDAYGSWEEHRELIKEVLEEGNDSCTLKMIPPRERVVTHLKGPSKILSEKMTEDVWTLEFLYDDVVRTLVYYYDTDFLDVWPRDIVDIDHIFCMGAFAWSDFVEYGDDSKHIIKMFENRTKSPWVYALEFNHMKFPIHLPQSFQEEGRTVSKKHFRSFKNKLFRKWWQKDYSA